MRKRYVNIGQVLAKIIDKNNVPVSWELEHIKTHWNSLDAILIKQAEPVKYFSRTLILKIADPVWKEEFEKNKESVILRIRTNLRGIKVENVEFI